MSLYFAANAGIHTLILNITTSMRFDCLPEFSTQCTLQVNVPCRGILPRKKFENLHAVMAILVLFE